MPNFCSQGQNDTGGAAPLGGTPAVYSPVALSANYQSNALMPANNNGYTGMQWVRTIFCKIFPFWAPGLSDPAAGQIFPTGAGQGGPGQVMPD
jgi:hypothetical protein